MVTTAMDSTIHVGAVAAAPALRWQALVDWSGTGSWGAADADVTNDLAGVSWRWGRCGLPTPEFVPAATVSLNLRNHHHRYTPGNAASPLAALVQPGREVWLRRPGRMTISQPTRVVRRRWTTALLPAAWSRGKSWLPPAVVLRRRTAKSAGWLARAGLPMRWRCWKPATQWRRCWSGSGGGATAWVGSCCAAPPETTVYDCGSPMLQRCWSRFRAAQQPSWPPATRWPNQHGMSLR